MISLTKKKRCRPGLLGIEKLGIIYAAFTAVVAAVFYNYIPSIGEMAITRAGYAAGMAALILIYRKRPCPSYLFPANSFAAWHAGNLVSGNLSLLQYIRQPGSRVRASRPIHFRMPARTSVQPDITRQNMERAFQYGIFFILSHDFLPRGMDILPPISVVRKNIFHNPLLILHLLRDIHVPARSGTAILLSGSGN